MDKKPETAASSCAITSTPLLGLGIDEGMIEMAMDCIWSSKRACTVQVQRTMRIGYARASRIMEELEKRGFLGPAKGYAYRDILRWPNPSLQGTGHLVDRTLKGVVGGQNSEGSK